MHKRNLSGTYGLHNNQQLYIITGYTSNELQTKEHHNFSQYERTAWINSVGLPNIDSLWKSSIDHLVLVFIDGKRRCIYYNLLSLI